MKCFLATSQWPWSKCSMPSLLCISAFDPGAVLRGTPPFAISAQLTCAARTMPMSAAMTAFPSCMTPSLWLEWATCHLVFCTAQPVDWISGRRKSKISSGVKDFADLPNARLRREGLLKKRHPFLNDAMVHDGVIRVSGYVQHFEIGPFPGHAVGHFVATHLRHD